MLHSPVKAARVLVADGHDLVVELLAFRLERLGYVVEAAQTTRELIRKLRQADYDAVVLDDFLPQVGGVEPLQWIKQQERYADTVVLMLASRRSEADVVRLLRLGADDCVSKPLNMDEMAARLGRALIKIKARVPSAAGRALRASVSMLTNLRLQDGAEIPCRLRDISRTGFMGESPQPLERGTKVCLVLPRLGDVAAQVMWSNATQVGGRFDEELDLSSLRSTRLIDLARQASEAANASLSLS